MTKHVLKSRRTVPTDQMVRFPEPAGRAKYTFSICAFPEADYPVTVREYVAFVKDYYARTGFRVDMPEVGYRIEQDESSLFSYAHSGRVMTIDPISTGPPGWKEFLEAFNEFCADHGGRPLFNQTWGISRQWVRQAYGDRVATFAEHRRRYDPQDRLLNRYFGELLAAE